MRHSFANRLLKSSNSLKAASRYPDHSSTAITADTSSHDDLSWDDLKDD
jgi:site-specific recombinase XerC